MTLRGKIIDVLDKGSGAVIIYDGRKKSADRMYSDLVCHCLH